MWTAFGEYLHQQKPKANADRFRAMSDDEQQKCVRRFWEIEDFADWLKQPASEPPREESRQECPYNRDGHCIGQKMMPECDQENCDRRIER